MLFALLPRAVLLDVAGPAEAFRLAERAVPGSYALRYIGSSRTIDSAVGLQIGSVQPLPRKVEDHSMIVVSGVTGLVQLESEPVVKLCEWLREIAKNETVTVMCVCAGAVVAARAGLLAHRECTTHHSSLEELSGVDPTAKVHANRIFVEDGRILSSAGVTAGIDLALYVIGNHLGHQVAAGVARELVVYLRRSGTDPQLSPWLMHRNHIHPVVHRVQDAVSRNPAGKWPARKLAELAHTSSRNLTRLFTQHAQCSPLDYVQRVRIALARELLAQSDLDVERVAEKAGFASAHQLRRVWRRWESAPPSAMRRGAPAP